MNTEANYFDHFGVEVSFLPDEQVLRKKYLQLSRDNHPDYSAGNDEKYEKALIATSLTNQAYKTLTDFDQRIKYVLELKGQPISTDDKLDPAFLMEMMEWNEEIMEVGMEEDGDKIKALSERFGGVENEYKQRLLDLIKEEETTQNPGGLGRIKEIYLQRKYLLRLRNSIDKFARL